MQKIILVITLIFSGCSGCGVDSQQKPGPLNNYGLGFHYDAMGESGLRIRYHAGKTTVPVRDRGRAEISILALAEDSYAVTKKCVESQMAIPQVAAMPLIIMVPVDSLLPHHGITHFDTNTIVIDNMAWDILVRIISNHEFTHLLSKKGEEAHDDPFFELCGPFLSFFS